MLGPSDVDGPQVFGPTGHLDDTGAVDDHVDAVDDGAERGPIGEVADPGVDSSRAELLRDGLATDEHTHRLAGRHEPLHHVAPDQPGCAGDEIAHLAPRRTLYLMADRVGWIDGVRRASNGPTRDRGRARHRALPWSFRLTTGGVRRYKCRSQPGLARTSQRCGGEAGLFRSPSEKCGSWPIGRAGGRRV
jgi:hypothetical protein